MMQQEQARNGEDSSERFVQLWTNAQPQVSSYVHSLVPDYHAAEDILQEVALAGLRKMAAYDPSRSFTGWCIGIARNQILRHRRANRRNCLLAHEKIVMALADTYEALEPEFRDRNQALESCLSALSEKNRALVRMRYREQRSMRDISKQVHANINAVKVALSRLRASLRRCIEKRMKEMSVS